MNYGLNEERLEELNADNSEEHAYACFCCGMPNKLSLEERAAGMDCDECEAQAEW